MKYTKLNTQTFLIILSAIILIFLVKDSYNRYAADYYMRKASLPLALHYAPKGDYYYRDFAGLVLVNKFGIDGDKKTYLMARRLLNQAHKLKPYDSYVLIHIVGLELLAQEKGIVKEPSEYTKKAARMLIRLDKYNALGQQLYNNVFPIPKKN